VLLARAVLPASAPSEQLVARVVERAGGNPFFLEELVRAIGTDGTDVVPETVTAALMARIARLDAAQRRVLEGAAVLDREAPLAPLTGSTRSSASTVASA
jgi:eukaryotic-like serine/threonine-protein kinase